MLTAASVLALATMPPVQPEKYLQDPAKATQPVKSPTGAGGGVGNATAQGQMTKERIRARHRQHRGEVNREYESYKIRYEDMHRLFGYRTRGWADDSYNTDVRLPIPLVSRQFINDLSSNLDNTRKIAGLNVGGEVANFESVYAALSRARGQRHETIVSLDVGRGMFLKIPENVQNDMSSQSFRVSDLFNLAIDPITSCFEHALAANGIRTREIPGGGCEVTIDFKVSLPPSILPDGGNMEGGRAATMESFGKHESKRNDRRAIPNIDFHFYGRFVLPPNEVCAPGAIPTCDQVCRNLCEPEILAGTKYDLYSLDSVRSPTPDHIKAFLPGKTIEELTAIIELASAAQLDLARSNQRLSEVEKLGHAYLNYVNLVVAGISECQKQEDLLRLVEKVGDHSPSMFLASKA